MSQNAAAAMIEARARQLWSEREKGFPKFTRLSWDDGARQAKDPMSVAAFDQLMAEGLIEMRDTGIYPGPNATAGKADERGLTPEMRDLLQRRSGGVLRP